jgi:hypothetical protein
MPGELLVDQAAQQRVVFIDRPGLLSRTDRLPNYGHRAALGDPPVPDYGRLIPDFF